jgi:hypothetical protein
MKNEKLREDNTPNNCTVPSDPIPKVGRYHSWNWLSNESNYRRCSTCGRVEWNNRAGKEEVNV